ncbi:MAG: serine hydrolase domain-containing protein [Candidatus Spyradocola sp.]|jgi:CubicO group peptidase (beta-lactamase class C family)
MTPMQFARTTPEAQGIDSAWLVRTLEAARTGAMRGIEIHDFLLLRHGKLVCEAYFAPYGPETKHAIYSQTKSFMATALGLALGDGLLKLEDRVLPYFPEVDPDTVCENGKKMRVCDLLAMASGHAEDAMEAFRQGGPKAYFALPVPYAPGERFVYNTGNSNMLGMLVERVTGKSLYAYLRERVFDKIGIEIKDGDWDRVQGACSGGFGLHATAMDVLRLANLYLLRGKWQGEQILPEKWVDLVSKKKIDNGDGSNSWGSGYSYQFWICDYADAYRIDGAGAQQAAIVPSEDMVILFNSALHGEVSDYAQVLARFFVMPGVKPAPLPENPAACARLAELTAAVAHPQPHAFVPVPEAALGAYRAQAEGAEWSEIALARGEGSLVLSLTLRGARMDMELGLDGVPRLSRWKDPEGQALQSCGWGAWEGGRFFGRVTLYPDIRTIWVDLEKTDAGLTAWLRTEWIPAIGAGKPQKFVRKS